MMNRFANQLLPRWRHIARHFFVTALALSLTLASSPLVLAAKKKAEEVAEPTKSYVMPYILVLMVIGLGLMTICRPSRRLDKMDESMKKKEDD